MDDYCIMAMYCDSETVDQKEGISVSITLEPLRGTGEPK